MFKNGSKKELETTWLSVNVNVEVYLVLLTTKLTFSSSNLQNNITNWVYESITTSQGRESCFQNNEITVDKFVYNRQRFFFSFVKY